MFHREFAFGCFWIDTTTVMPISLGLVFTEYVMLISLNLRKQKKRSSRLLESVISRFLRMTRGRDLFASQAAIS